MVESRRALFVCSVITYLCAMPLPAILFTAKAPLLGYEVFMWGWWGVLLAQFAWFANPMYALAVINYRLHRMDGAKYSTVIAIGLGLSSFLAKEWWFNEGSGTPITGFGPGYFVWMLSFVFLFVACLIKQPGEVEALSLWKTQSKNFRQTAQRPSNIE